MTLPKAPVHSIKGSHFQHNLQYLFSSTIQPVFRLSEMLKMSLRICSQIAKARSAAGTNRYIVISKRFWKGFCLGVLGKLVILRLAKGCAEFGHFGSFHVYTLLLAFTRWTFPLCKKLLV